MIDPASWGWPQYTILILLFLGMAIHAAQHGKPVTTPYSFPTALCRVVLWGSILVLGGFFA